MELFDKGIFTAISVIEKAYGCIEYDAGIDGVMDILQDQAYDTGMAQGKQMQFFDIIYEEKA